ncbi:class 1b ribonucleoside-diphosphate reductase subunit alpha [Corynebacterium pseudodiphtheriticum]|uniref:class 1b ribonucleoside-diphosphate reductase subunit alpha n=1 Tax=Corynebacterium pseudodiphtheriticum TaxID=37637 RepID=UPI00201BB575|nr:class 1b ribonucleoside-diphosphate reductase subunit alpha [Corynebacterium pseudodiphtheriticum]UQV56345.1 class 1b ribonucleoside-diphosphate reductase subunit alpha [Corynebacterium pseudodiphtheriticum]
MSQSYLALNAELNLFDAEGNLQVHKDKEAAKAFFLEHVNQNTVFFHSLEEKVRYMTSHGYWDAEVLDKYSFGFVKDVFKQAYRYKFRFDSFVGAYKFYKSYALKNFKGDRYLERFEDRVAMVALALADGNKQQVVNFVSTMMLGIFQPATPTFLNAGRPDAGELVSCFLLRLEDNMESIGRGINSALQLSKRGGGVALLLSNLREAGAPIKHIENQSSGVIPVMKLLEDAFSYANQLGARQGAGAVYLNAHHPDILSFLDTKRENADEKIRIKSLSLGVVVPDITFELARENKDMYLFSPYDVERELGKPFADVSITEHYTELSENPRIRKTKISARRLFQTIAEIQFESGYPYLMFEDTVNRANPITFGRINMSNLCSEILQINQPSQMSDDLTYTQVGTDISCNLGSLNIQRMMEHCEAFGGYVSDAVRMLTAVSTSTNIESVPTVEEGNRRMRSIGLGQMNLHGFFANNGIHYDSAEAWEFTRVYFALVRYHALQESVKMAKQHGEFIGFHKTDYANGKALEWYLENDCTPQTVKVKTLFQDIDHIPDADDWAALSRDIQHYGLFHSYLLAVPPTGNISYVNGSTASIHPVTAPVEIRKEGKLGRVYYPAPGLSEETLPYYRDAYEIGPEPIIDLYAEATRHTDQGLSLTLFFRDTATTRDINRAQVYAWKKGIKTIYYVRLRQAALEGTNVEECVSCTL